MTDQELKDLLAKISNKCSSFTEGLAYANGSINETYVVKVKSHLREEAIYAHKTLMGNFRALFYVARIQDETLC